MTKPANQEPALELSNLSKRYGNSKAVDQVSLKVERGTTLGLIGPNGAGKTTTLKMLMGILVPTSGVAWVLGSDVFADPLAVKRRVGYVPSSHHVDRWMRISDAIAFCRSFYDSWNDNICQDLVERFELDPRKKVKQLSKGTLVKLSLVLAVSHEPEILLLDEPMAGLDPLAREEFLDGVLQAVCERQQTVIFSTHSLDDVQRLADTVAILYEGRLLAHENIETLLSTTKRIQATLTNGHLPAQLPEKVIWQQVEGRKLLLTVGDFSPEKVQLIRAQEGVEHVEVVDLGLEDLFKDLVKGRKAAS